MEHASNFESTETGYDKVNYIDGETWSKKKLYDETPYLVLPKPVFTICLGDSATTLKCYVKKLGEQFGDPIPLPNLSDYTVTIKIYGGAGIVGIGQTEITDVELGEISYTFTPFDFYEPGMYHFTLEFKKTGSSFTLPNTNIKNKIIVKA